jgi:hypothetical protein
VAPECNGFINIQSCSTQGWSLCLLDFAMLCSSSLPSICSSPMAHSIQSSNSSPSTPSPPLPLLSLILTSAYVFFLILLVLLAPLVSQFQLFRTDVVDLKEFPIEFYHPAVVKEIHRRFNAELDRKAFEDRLETRLGIDMLRYIQGYVEDYPRVWK